MSFTFAFCSPTIVMLENTSLPEAYLPVGRQAGPSADGQGGSMAMDGPVSKTKTDLPAHRAEAPYRLVRAEAKPISLRPAPIPVGSLLRFRRSRGRRPAGCRSPGGCRSAAWRSITAWGKRRG